MPFQQEAVNFLKPEMVRNEMAVLQRHFRDKRDYVLERFSRMGFDMKVRWGGGGKVVHWDEMGC